MAGLASARFAPALLAATAPVLTLLRVALPSPQSLPVAACAFLIRTLNREPEISLRWSYEALPRGRGGAGGAGGVVSDWTEHLERAASEGRGGAWERAEYVLYTEVRGWGGGGGGCWV